MNYVKPDEAPKFKTDEVIEQHGVKVFVDPKAIFYVVGTSVEGRGRASRTTIEHLNLDAHALHVSALLCVSTMDYVDSDVASEFVFKNPNSKGSCGCGESFNV